MWGTSRCSTIRPLAASSSRHGAGHLQAAGHRDVVGDRQQQRAGLGVGVAGPEHGLHLEGGPARVGRVDAPAVVHDALEHGEGPDPHRACGEHGRVWGTTPTRSTTRPTPPRCAATPTALADAVDRRAAGLGRAVGRRPVPGVARRGAARRRAWRRAARPAPRRSPTSRRRCGRCSPRTSTSSGATRWPIVRRRGRAVPPRVLPGAPGVRPVVAGRRTPSGSFPDDDYDLDARPPSPTSTRRCTSPGCVWGAAKAHVILPRARRRAEGSPRER